MQHEAHGLSRSGNILTDADMLRAAPSIFAAAPKEVLSDRYSFLPTYQVVNGLRDNGFMPFSARQSYSVEVGNREFTRHEIRFRHVSTIERLRKVHTPGQHLFLETPEEFDEIILINSHDGSSQFELMRGVFRLLCSNGLVVGGSGGDAVRIRHTGDAVSNVIEGATRILEDTDKLVLLRDDMRSLKLDKDEQVAFAQATLQLRYNHEPAPITPSALLQRRRPDDVRDDLWTVFNVVQENMIKGGLRGHTINSGRRMTTRGITGITQDIAVNKMLWSLAEAARNMRSTLDLDGPSMVEAPVALYSPAAL